MKLLTNVSIIGLLLSGTVGCGAAASSDGGGTSGTTSCAQDDARLLVDLTTAELTALCDCAATLGGGYGQSKTCATGQTVKTPTDQASCLASQTRTPASCVATAGESLSCAAEAQQCNFTGPGCQAIILCH